MWIFSDDVLEWAARTARTPDRSPDEAVAFRAKVGRTGMDILRQGYVTRLNGSGRSPGAPL